jgi:hypothetical protein
VKRKKFHENFFGIFITSYHALRASISGQFQSPIMIFHMPKSMVKKEKNFFLAFSYQLLSCPQGMFTLPHNDFPYVQVNGEKRKKFVKKFFLAFSYHPLSCPQGISKHPPYDFSYAQPNGENRKKFS